MLICVNGNKCNFESSAQSRTGHWEPWWTGTLIVPQHWLAHTWCPYTAYDLTHLISNPIQDLDIVKNTDNHQPFSMFAYHVCCDRTRKACGVTCSVRYSCCVTASSAHLTECWPCWRSLTPLLQLLSVAYSQIETGYFQMTQRAFLTSMS